MQHRLACRPLHAPVCTNNKGGMHGQRTREDGLHEFGLENQRIPRSWIDGPNEIVGVTTRSNSCRREVPKPALK